MPDKSTTFKFGWKDKVLIRCSNESGKVIGRSEYAHANPSYLIRYKSADGRAVEGWWSEEALTLCEA